MIEEANESTTIRSRKGGEGSLPERLGTYGGYGSGSAELSSVPSVPSDRRNPWSRQGYELLDVLDASSSTPAGRLDVLDERIST